VRPHAGRAGAIRPATRRPVVGHGHAGRPGRGADPPVCGPARRRGLPGRRAGRGIPAVVPSGWGRSQAPSGLARPGPGREPRRPVSPHTIFAIASMSKAFVSVLATQLVAEGVLSLTDRLATWVPEFPNAENVTILQLLTGTSGITDDNEHPFTAVDDDPSRR